MSWLGAPSPPLRHRPRVNVHAAAHMARSASGTSASVGAGANGSAAGPSYKRPQRPTSGAASTSSSASTSPTTPSIRAPTPSSAHHAHARRRRKSKLATQRKRRLPRMGVRWLREGFRRFGEHCARNQIRTLLIDCVVMTTLFYPAIAGFLSKRFESAAGPSRAPAPGLADSRSRAPLGFLTEPLGYVFFPPPPPLLPNVAWGPWWARDDDDASWVPVPVADSPPHQPEIELLRVAWADVGGVLDGEDSAWAARDDAIVSAVRTLADTADTWARGPDGAQQAACVRHLVADGADARPTGTCYLLTPADEPRVYGATPIDALWGRQGAERQTYRGVAVPFHVQGNASAFRDKWEARLADLVAPLGAEVFTEPYARPVGPDDSVTLVSYAPGPRATPETSSVLPPRLIVILYGVLFTTLLMQLSNATKVHSRFGLAFTGIVQLCCSAVMSFSVLSLLGWNGWGWSNGQTVLPTYALPFVIVVVGIENMSTLTKAVFSVPFSHSVPVRIGIGLSKVGHTIALTSLTDLVLLGLVWLCVSLQPVREFCVFAVVVIVTDWFMLNTFFLTVLSIDAQRLELADVLASNGGLSSHEAERQEKDKEDRRSPGTSTAFSWNSFLRARTTKSGSLILLLVSVGALYYFNERERVRVTFNSAARLYGYTPTSTSALAPRPTAVSTTALDLAALTLSEAFWRAINVDGWSSVRIRIPASSIAIFPRPGHSLLPADIRKLPTPARSFQLPRLGPLCYFAKVVIIPQFLTALALYVVLLYLLKDRDLLDAQRNRLGRGDEANASDDESDDAAGVSNRPGKTSLAAGVGVHMLPASHESDVDVIAASPDGKMAVSISIDNSVCLWRFIDDERSAGTREMVSTNGLGAGDPIVGAAVSRDHQFIAVATRHGSVQLWATPDDGKTEPLGPIQIDSEGRTTSIIFEDSPSVDDPFTASPRGQGRQHGRPTLLVGLSDGSVRAITGSNRVMDIVPPVEICDPLSAFRVDLLSSESGPIALAAAPEGTTMWTKQHGEWASVPLISSLDPSDRVLAVSRARVDWDGRRTNLVALGRRSGRAEVFDAEGSLVASLNNTTEPLRAIAIAAPGATRCTKCDQHSSDGFFVLSSTATHVFVDRVVSRTAGMPFCRCPMNRRPSVLDDALGLVGAAKSKSPASIVLPPSPSRTRTVSGGFNSPLAASPIKGSLAPPSNGEFPLSSHGARRLSGWRERDSQAREALAQDRDELRCPPSPLGDRSNSVTALSSLPSLSSLAVSSADESNGTAASPSVTRRHDAEVLSLGAVLARDGGWAVLDTLVVGVRRAGSGIDDSQWQLWALDLSAPWSGTALLVDVASLDVLERRTRSHTAPRDAPGSRSGSGSGATLTPRDASTADTSREMPMRARRAERMLSMNGRASFPSALGSFSVPTHQPLGYVAVGPVRVVGGTAALAGFGNRIGVLAIPTEAQGRRSLQLPQKPPGGVSGGVSVGSAMPGSLPTIAITTPRRQLPPPPKRDSVGVGAGATGPGAGAGTGAGGAGGAGGVGGAGTAGGAGVGVGGAMGGVGGTMGTPNTPKS